MPYRPSRPTRVPITYERERIGRIVEEQAPDGTTVLQVQVLYERVAATKRKHADGSKEDVWEAVRELNHIIRGQRYGADGAEGYRSRAELEATLVAAGAMTGEGARE